jgi:succinate dehydrogenase / fumarate reductase membrane anchor subunit
MTTETIPAPRSSYAPPKRRRVNWEKWGWIYQRVSGLLLVVLIFGHLFVNLVAGNGVRAIDFAFVAGKWADPFWVVWDTLLLWLALIHGANGMRTITNDYARNPMLRRLILLAILAATVVLLVLGTLVIYTFDPCPANAVAGSLPDFCPAP